MTAIAQTTEQALYDTLSEIGTRRRSIAPHVLKDYDVLLNCPLVKARLEPTKDRADIAHAVLKEAVASIASKTDRLVAEAILALNRFEGELVDERKRMLADIPKYGCSAESYKNRRPRVLREVVSYLMQTGRPTPPINRLVHNLATIDTGDQRVPVGRDLIDSLASDAIELYYEILTTLFVADLDSRLLATDDVYHDSAETVWVMTSKRIYNSYVDFLSSCQALLERQELIAEPGLSERNEEREKLLQFLPDETTDTLWALYHSVRFCGPEKFHSLHAAYFELHALARRFVGFARPVIVDRQISLYASDLPSEEDGVPNFYLDAWETWFFGRFPRPEFPNKGFSSRSDTVDFERIAAKAEMTYRLVTGNFSYGHHYRERARRAALAALSSYYTVDDGTVLSSGLSLREEAVAFFERMAQKLDDSGIVWFDRDDE